MRAFVDRVLRWIGSQSVFTLLLITTIASTLLLSFVLILSLQRIADEHPRRYLARALFHEIVEQAQRPGAGPVTVGGIGLIRMTPEEATRSDFAALFAATAAIATASPSNASATAMPPAISTAAPSSSCPNLANRSRPLRCFWWRWSSSPPSASSG